LGAVDAGGLEGFVEHSAGGSDEGFAGEVFLVAGLFADEDEVGVIAAFAVDTWRSIGSLTDSVTSSAIPAAIRRAASASGRSYSFFAA
jgi:hypothetical protein